MGCCGGREEDMNRLRQIKEADNSKMQKKFKKNETASVEVQQETNPTTIENSEFGQKNMMNYLEYCKSQKNYSELIKYVSDPSEIINSKVYIGWSQKPQTIGALALVYLCKICKDHAKEITPLLYPILPELVENLRSGTDDLRDSSLLLLYYLLDFAPEDKIKLLVDLQIFSVLMRSIMCSVEQLRHLTAGVCYKIYKNRPYAQKLFIDMNGGRQLVQQISWSSENDVNLRMLLEYLSELLQDNDEEVMQGYIAKLNEDRAIDIIRDISNTDKSAETLEAMDYLISILSDETKGQDEDNGEDQENFKKIIN